MLRSEDEEAGRSLKAGKSPGVDNILSELLKNEGEATTAVLTVISEKIWETKEMAVEVDTIACHRFTKERQLQAMSELS